MKIVDRTHFLCFPSNTVFSKYEPCVFEGLMVKGESLLEINDFIYEDIDSSAVDSDSSEDYAYKLFEAQSTGISVGLDFDQTARDGFFEDTQLFAVWEKDDVRKLIEKLQECL